MDGWSVIQWMIILSSWLLKKSLKWKPKLDQSTLYSLSHATAGVACQGLFGQGITGETLQELTYLCQNVLKF